MNSSDALSAVSIEINGHTFRPQMLYQIFPDDKLFGHVAPELKITFNRRYEALYEFTSSKSTKNATDVIGEMKKVAGPYATFDKSKFNSSVEPENIGGTDIAIWGGDRSYTVKKFKPSQLRDTSDLLTKIQIFTLFFIEGGSFIDQTDDNWEIYLLMHHNEFIGFATIYPYLYYESGQVYDRRPHIYRKRISQFLILPPYQHKGYGSRLLESLYKNMFVDNKVREITVEDPTEVFDNMRERVCLKIYEQFFNELPVIPTPELLAAAAINAKSDTKTFTQLFEMFYLQHQGETAELQKMIKTRIWRQNYLELKGETREEQKSKLGLVYDNILRSYRTVLGITNEAKRRRT